MASDEQRHAAFEWDYRDVYDGPWRVDTEPRTGERAIRSGVFTVLTAGEYFDAGGPLDERLQFICDAVNAQIAGCRAWLSMRAADRG